MGHNAPYQGEDIGTYSAAERAKELRANGRQIRFRYELLDRALRSKGFVTSVAPSGRITYNWLAEVKRTAQFSLEEDADFDRIVFLQDHLKPHFQLLMPDGMWADWSLGVFLLDNPHRQSEGGRVLHSVKGHDRGVVLRQESLTKRFTLNEGDNIIDTVRGVLDERGLHSDVSDKSATSPHDRTWDIGTDVYELVNDLLDMVNYASLFFDPEGVAGARPYRAPTDREANLTYRTDELSVIAEQATEELDLFDTPNVWILSASQPDRDDLTAIFRNTDPDSPTSIPARGRRIVRHIRENEDAANVDVLKDRVHRIAAEAGSVFRHLTFSTILDPRHGENDILAVEHTPLGLDLTNWSETEWSMTLKAGELMSHKARRTFQLPPDPEVLTTGQLTIATLPDIPTPGRSEFADPVQPPVSVVLTPVTSVPGTVKNVSSIAENAAGATFFVTRGNGSDTPLNFLAVGAIGDDPNIAAGTVSIRPDAGSLTSVLVSFGKALSGTPRVFLGYSGAQPGTKLVSLRTDEVTDSDFLLYVHATNTTQRVIHWFAIVDPLEDMDHGSVELDGTGTVASEPVTFARTLPAPVRVFATIRARTEAAAGQNLDVDRTLVAVDDVTTAGATVYGHSADSDWTNYFVDWLAIGGRG